MAKLSRAQIAAGFGGKRRKVAARAARKKKRTNRPKAKHRARTKPRKRNAARKVITGYGSTVMNRSRRKKRNAASKTNVVFNKPKRRKRKNGSAKRKTKRKNTGAIFALANPAGRKKVAQTKRRKTRRKRAAGSTRRRTNRGRSRVASRRNAPMGRPADWLALGSGAIVGGLGATSLPQMILGASNNGPMGYLGMAAATALLAAAGHFAFKKNTMLTSGIVAGGAGAIIKRIIGDYTPYGSYLNANAGASGMGDYLSGWNFTTPQIIGGNGGNNQLGAAGTIPVSVAGVGQMGNSRALMNV